MPNALFSSSELQQYTQQIQLDKIGTSGQKKLKQARVLCIGLGGLGSPSILYLAAAGVGTLGIADHDQLEPSNLNRQILYQHKQINQNKATAAKEQIHALNPFIQVNAYPVKVTQENAEELLVGYDLVIDGSDNFSTRYLVHDLCYQLKKPYVFASVYQFEGYSCLFNGTTGPCLRCLFPKPPTRSPRCDEAGVLGVLPGLLGVIQATEVLKYILNLGDSLEQRLLTVDLLKMKFREIQLSRNPNCSCCTAM